jgi:hypothetical protein
MRATIRVAVVGLFLMLAQSVVRAQACSWSPSLMLIAQESVQKELKVTGEQKWKINKIADKAEKRFREIIDGDKSDEKLVELEQENQKVITALLSPEQSQRLKEITYQQDPAMALIDPEVSEALNLTEEQQREVWSIHRETRGVMQKLSKLAPTAENQKKRDDLRKGREDMLMALLTPAQKTKWTALQGEPFKGETSVGAPRQQ